MTSYFIGNDPSQWRTGIHGYATVRYSDIYPGIDVIYHGDQSSLEYDFEVAPHADPDVIRMAFDADSKVALDSEGKLTVSKPAGTIQIRPPGIYQTIGASRRAIDGSFVLDGAHGVRFKLASYDRTRPLTIDPQIVYSTYLGGTTGGPDFPEYPLAYLVVGDQVRGVATDKAGNVYVTGSTSSTDFPTLKGPFGPGSGPDPRTFLAVFVAKFGPDGSLIYSTYLGGTTFQVIPTAPYNYGDVGNSIAVDGNGNAYITGYTGTPDFPTTAKAFAPARSGSDAAVFVSKLSANGSSLLYSSVFGGSKLAVGQAIAVDGTGIARITGLTTSIDFPVTAFAFQPANAEMSITSPLQEYDAFLFRMKADGSGPAYSTYFGGSDEERAYGIALDSSGNDYITGFTVSPDLPIKNPLPPGRVIQEDPRCAGGVRRSFETTALSAIPRTSREEEGDDDRGLVITVDTAGAAYVTGRTIHLDFPTTAGAFQTKNPAAGGVGDNYSLKGPMAAFVAKLSPDDTNLAYSTIWEGRTTGSWNGLNNGSVHSTIAILITFPGG